MQASYVSWLLASAVTTWTTDWVTYAAEWSLEVRGQGLVTLFLSKESKEEPVATCCLASGGILTVSGGC